MKTKKSLRILVLTLAVVMVFAVCSTAFAMDEVNENELNKAKMIEFVKEANDTNTAGLEIVYTGNGLENADAEIAKLEIMIDFFEENKKKFDKSFTAEKELNPNFATTRASMSRACDSPFSWVRASINYIYSGSNMYTINSASAYGSKGVSSPEWYSGNYSGISGNGSAHPVIAFSGEYRYGTTSMYNAYVYCTL